MNNSDSSTIMAATVVSLRHEPDALHLITAKLRVNEMGPADHIRTKHEVRDFLKAGDLTMAEGIVARAQARRDLQQASRQDLTQRQGQSMTQ